MMQEIVRSVGIDIGTSTTQLVFSRLVVENLAGNYAVPRISIVEKEVIYRSKIYFTPLRSPTEIDTEKVKDIVDKYPENVIRMPTAPSEWFVYKVTDGNADMINPSDDPNKMFAQFKDEAKKFCNQLFL